MGFRAGSRRDDSVGIRSAAALSRGTGRQRALFDSEGRRARSSTDDEKTPGAPLGDVWEIGIVAPVSKERTGYPTQKPEKLLDRIVRASSAPGATVADLMCGSGTTLVAAARLGRRFVGGDRSRLAFATARERLDREGIAYSVIEVPGFSKEFCGGTHVSATGEIGLFLLTSEQGVSAGTRRVEALTGDAAVKRAQADQSILEELEQTAKVDRRELVDEYAKLREQLKAREREIQALRLKLATGAGAASGGEDLADVGGVLVWTPRHEGLDRKGHAEVVDDFRNRHKGKRFALVSTSVAEEGVSVIAAVSPELTGSLKAPEVLKQLGLRGGGRPDFAQGGGVAPGDVEALRAKARELLKGAA